MKLRFTKMHGAGNDFIVLDATQNPVVLTASVLQQLAARHFGIGADQILMVEPSPEAGIDFGYRIFNADGAEVQQCGNGARCFMRYVHAKGLTDKKRIQVRSLGGDIFLEITDNGDINVNMGAPVFELARIPFIPANLQAVQQDQWEHWVLPVSTKSGTQMIACMVVSMGNPHAVIRVEDIDAAPVACIGPAIENLLSHFPERVNVGFMQVVSRGQVNVRVYERGAGETLACGTGICAAVTCGIRMGWLNERVQVQAKGGQLLINWHGMSGGLQEPITMTGPAQIVYEGEIEL